ncbi:MAG: sensor histidine kinase [Janthinobacterium lividum]
MGLRTKLVAGTLLFTFVLVVSLSLVFLSEVLRERIAQTESTNSVLLHQVLSSTSTALQAGMVQHPPLEGSEAAFERAVQAALQSDADVTDTLNGYVRYSPDIEEAYVSGGNGLVLVSSTPGQVNRPTPLRRSFAEASDATFRNRRKLLFGKAETLDISLPLDRNGSPFLVVHLGIRSTFLRNAYSPWLHTAATVCLLALGGSLLVAGALSAAALRPIERIARQLEVLTGRVESGNTAIARGDAVERVSSTISRLDAQMRTSEQTRFEIATNLNSMLHALKDGVMLFTADMRLATASDAVANFLPATRSALPGMPLLALFPAGTAVGDLLSTHIPQRRNAQDVALTLEDGRMVELSLNCNAGSGMGALVTLHDVAAAQELEHEVQVARRLASIGRLMAGVGHEVKNPINAMVVHLELLRGKLAEPVNLPGAQRHVDVLASEMSRLDRVVQTLADFSRPMEPALRDEELKPIVQSVLRLVSADAASHNVLVTLHEDAPGDSICILCDAELLRQALLNVCLNAMQAMPGGGELRIAIGRDRHAASLSLTDTGEGIAPELLQRIFDLYFTTKSTGSGIGLAMTYRIVQLHGGVIEVQSEADVSARNHGTTFTLRLPLAKKPARLLRETVSV